MKTKAKFKQTGIGMLPEDRKVERLDPEIKKNLTSLDWGIRDG